MRTRRWGEAALFIHIHILRDKRATKSLDSLSYPSIPNVHAPRDNTLHIDAATVLRIGARQSWSLGPADLAYFDHINGECLVMPPP